MASRRPAPTRRPAPRPAPRPTRRPRRRTVLGWVLGLLVTGLVLAVGGFAAAYALVKVPDPNTLADAQTSTVYFSDGTTKLGTFAALNRQNVTLDQVPDHVQKAVLAAEDRTFYENRGVSPTGIARALWSNVSDGTSQGGSTLTQQYVKNYYLTDQHSYRRKFEEFFIALKIDQQQTKDETLQNYLNTVYFGRSAYGIQAASQAYFGIDASQLNVSQGALLAALLKGPSNYDPRKGPEQTAAATARVKYVLDGMVSQGWLSAADRATAGLPETIESKPASNNQWQGPNGYLLKTVENELTSPTVGLTEEDVERGGLKIVTTFDAKAQAAATDAVTGQLPKKLPDGFHVALSAIDPKTGGVTAMYGGPDYLANQYNDVTQAVAQPGSTFKPFALVAGLEQGISLKTTFDSSSPRTVEGWTVKNYGDEEFGRIDLVTATEHSVNTVYAQLNAEVTPAKTRDVAIAAGYPQDTTGLQDNIANVLGTASPHPIDVTQAYATFAAQGQRTQWHTVATIDDSTGTRTYTASPAVTTAFGGDVAADATYAMEQVVNSGTGSYAKRLNRPAAGKTGTTNDSMAAWFAGFTPDLAASVALFQTSADGRTNVKLDLGGGEVTGGSYPVRIWTAFMKAALDGTPKTDFPDRANVGSAKGSGSGSSSSSSSSSTQTQTQSQSPTTTGTPTDTPTQTPTDTPTGTPTGEPTGTPTSSSTRSPAASSTGSTGSPTSAGSSGGPAGGSGGGDGAQAQPSAAVATNGPAGATAGAAAGAGEGR